MVNRIRPKEIFYKNSMERSTGIVPMEKLIVLLAQRKVLFELIKRKKKLSEKFNQILIKI